VNPWLSRSSDGPSAAQEEHGLAIGSDHTDMCRSMIGGIDDHPKAIEAQ
jgi:hypothetical protein